MPLTLSIMHSAKSRRQNNDMTTREYDTPKNGAKKWHITCNLLIPRIKSCSLWFRRSRAYSIVVWHTVLVDTNYEWKQREHVSAQYVRRHFTVKASVNTFHNVLLTKPVNWLAVTSQPCSLAPNEGDLSRRETASRANKRGRREHVWITYDAPSTQQYEWWRQERCLQPTRQKSVGQQHQLEIDAK